MVVILFKRRKRKQKKSFKGRNIKIESSLVFNLRLLLRATKPKNIKKMTIKNLLENHSS